MNPSTSSNADSARAAAFKVGTRQLSPELTAVGEEYSAREIGQISGPRLVELSQKLAQIAPGQLISADPHLVVGSRRGRFMIRPGQGKLRLFDASDPARAFLELTPEEVPAYLDGTEPARPGTGPEIPAESIEPPNTRLGLVIALFVLSVFFVCGSAYFTFRETNFDPDSDYTPATADQLAAWRREIPGVFATGKSESPRVMTIRADGSVTLVESGPNNTIADKRDDTYQFALLGGKTPTARTTRLGPIEIYDSKTLGYAGETYTRQP